MKYRIFTAGLFSIAAITAILWGFSKSQPVSADHKNQNIALWGTLEGFEPGSQVSYSIFPEQGSSLKGNAEVDKNGKLKLPGYNLRRAAGAYLAYDLEVNGKKESDEPLNMRFILNSRSGKIATQVSGLRKFSEIALNSPSIDQKTRADWAGLFKDTEAGNFKDIDSKQGFQLALFDTNIMNDAERQHPKIIKVLAAPGGGQYDDPNLNTYDFPYGCNDGQSPTVDYSFCDTASMDAQIDSIVDNYVTALMMMGEQLTAVMITQLTPVAAMIDAKQQLETQREIRKLVAEAHKDYQPSELMCEFGSYVKSISTSEEKIGLEKQAINKSLMQFYKNTVNTSGAEGYAADIDSRMDQFRRVYCDLSNNNAGLQKICDWDQAGSGTQAGAADAKRKNKDIDYERTLGFPLTMDINFSAPAASATPDETDIIALAKNLYWPRVLDANEPEAMPKKASHYLDARHVFAMTNVAHNSLASIAAMKSRTEPNALGAESGPAFMKSMMRNFGMTDDEINEILGDNPSYYAQMEVLTKKLYQQPDFYTNLIDKPTNVKRINASMEAFRIMQERDMYESALRREMLTSIMVQTELAKHIDKLDSRISEGKGNMEPN